MEKNIYFTEPDIYFTKLMFILKNINLELQSALRTKYIFYRILLYCNGVTRDIGKILSHSFLDTGEWRALWTRIYVFVACTYIYADISAINICWNMLNLVCGYYLKWMGSTMIFGCHWDTPPKKTSTSLSCEYVSDLSNLWIYWALDRSMFISICESR